MHRPTPVRHRARRPRGLVLLVTGAMLAAVAGCGGDDEAEPTDTQASTPNSLVGTYATTLGPSGPELDEPNPPGKWKLLVTSETEAYFQPPEGPSFPVGNPIELSAGRIVLAPDPECPTQTGTPGNGEYEWSLDGGTLTFTDVKDSCRDRSFVLTSKPWSRVK
jgi:hypothetical protein